MQALGISMDLAEKIAKEGLTDENKELLATELANNNADAASITTTTAKVGSIMAETGAEKEENRTRKNGLVILWEKIKTGAVHIAQTIAATVAQWAENVAMWMGCTAGLALTLIIGLMVIGLIALVAIIWAVIAAIQSFIKNSPEAQLKSAEEAADAAGEAAERTAEAYNNLADAFDSLGDKYDSLEELTKGTEEWKKAVEEINTEVLDLIEKYPELAGLVDNDEGVLTLEIDGEEAQKVLQKYEMDAAKASAASYAAKINVNEKKANVRANEIANKTFASNGDVTYEMTPETTKALAEAI
jgi:hypothetical protein